MKGILWTAVVLAAFVVLSTRVVAVPSAGKPAPAPPAAAGPAAVGAKAPGFSLPGLDNAVVDLRQFAGKKAVLLAFWATWCPHCNESVPDVNRLHGDGRLSKKVQVLALNFRESPQKVSGFVAAKKVRYPVLLDRDGEVARRYGVVGIPTYVVVSRDGRVVFRDHELPRDVGALVP